MRKPEIKEIHERCCRVVIERNELERLVRARAMDLAGFTDFATEAKVTFPDATEGSPPYRVGTYCVVDLVEDQGKFSKEAAQ